MHKTPIEPFLYHPLPDYQSNAFEYNRQTLQEYQLARDYHLLRYKLSQRDDSEFWQHCQNIELPESLSHALALFKSHGRQPDYDEGLIAKHRWVTAFTGQGVWPENCHPLTATVDVNAVAKEFAQMRTGIAKTVESMPGHQDFIRRFCGV